MTRPSAIRPFTMLENCIADLYPGGWRQGSREIGVIPHSLMGGGESCQAGEGDAMQGAVPNWYLNSVDQGEFGWYRSDEVKTVSYCWNVTNKPGWV